MLRVAAATISFLTIFPVRPTSLERTAKCMWFFPVVGQIIGFIVGGFALGISGFLDPLLVGLFSAAALAIITGLHHSDGLADFADGLMTRGSRQKKLAAMKDLSTGTAGTVTLVLYFIGLVIAISLTQGEQLLRAIVVAEVLAKFSMVLLAGLGRSAAPGSATPFIIEAKSNIILIGAAALMLSPVILIGQEMGLLMLGTTIITVLIILGISRKCFGGVTGDVLGATNELTRLTCLMVYVL